MTRFSERQAAASAEAEKDKEKEAPVADEGPEDGFEVGATVAVKRTDGSWHTAEIIFTRMNEVLEFELFTLKKPNFYHLSTGDPSSRVLCTL